ncbi:[acyl-carrier-protein] S-malonyltransferase [Anaerolineae bacterium]|nr:[acyl-carrier-protein] S-malonyltransferase [Anaerolineae bacterium]
MCPKQSPTNTVEIASRKPLAMTDKANVKTAFVFPGQGSQFVGMAQDLVANYPEARAVFEQADAALGFALSQLCFAGPDNVLTDTINAQPALLTHSIAALRVLQTINREAVPVFTAGHSLGEYSALVASDVMDFADGVILVRERGRLMKQAGEATPGAMASVLGMNEIALESVCNEAGAQIANYNNPGQIVISGTKDAIQRASALAKERGARRVVPLAVSIAAHSRLMEPAAREFTIAVNATPMRAPSVPVISNVTAQPLASVEAIKHDLVAQLTSSVLWIKSIEYIVAQGVTHFVELGPKDAVAGMIRRINSNVHAVSIGDVASVKAFGEAK